MDTNEMTSQLCDLSQLEATQQTNDYLEDLLVYETSINNTNAVNLIGKTVISEGSNVSLSNGVADELLFELTDDAAQVSVTIYDEDGQAVKTTTQEDTSAGEHSVTWDGTDDAGVTLPDGTYSFEVAAYDADGNTVETTTSIESEITGVIYKNGTTYLVTAAGEEIPLGSVTEVSQT